VPPPAARSRVSGRALAGSCLASLPLASCRRCCWLRSRLLGRPRAPTLLVSRPPAPLRRRRPVTALHASSLHRAVTAAPHHCVASAYASTSLLVPTTRTWACRGRSRVVSPLTAPRPPCCAATAARMHVSSPSCIGLQRLHVCGHRVPPRLEQAAGPIPFFPLPPLLPRPAKLRHEYGMDGSCPFN
jgi:hypothetical protein